MPLQSLSDRPLDRLAAAVVLLVLLLSSTGVAPAAAAEPTGRLLEGHDTRVMQARFGTPETIFAAEGAIQDQLIVTYAEAGTTPGTTRGGLSSLTRMGARHQQLADRVSLVTADEKSMPEVVARLAADPSVVAVEPNVRRSFSAVPDDTSYAKQWSHVQTDAAGAWDLFTGVAPSTAPLIAILDSGIDATHPDLQGVVVQSLRSANGRVIPGASANDPCGIGHGTAVAGSAAARGDNGFGVAGVLWQARVIDIALTSPENGCPGGPSDADTITAMNHVTSLAERPHVINLSLGASLRDGEACSAGYQAAADQARAAGIVVVAAAGNDSSTRPSVPASCDGVISVAATGSDGARAAYSQRNPQVDIAAPGGGFTFGQCPTFDQLVSQMVITTSLTSSSRPVSNCPAYVDPDGHRLQGISGTSFSSPYVAAGIALLRQLALERGSSLTPDQTEAIIESTATDAGTPGRDCEFGWGILDLGAAAQAVAAGERPALQPDPPVGQGTCDGQPVASFTRIAAGSGDTTDPTRQAVAVSALLPDGSAPYAVLSRVDDFADALAGSALGFGIGPLLYTDNVGPLDARTREELARVLDFDGRTPWVYVMGGPSAIPAGVDDTLRSMGITAIRIQGTGREATAVQASAEMEQLKAAVTFPTRDFVFLAYGRDFPDAVSAGQMAARYGIPVLLTDRVGPLHPDTRAELERLAPEQVIVLGGTAVMDEAVVTEVRAMGLDVVRLSGPSRVDTAVAVADRYVQELAADLAAGEPVGQPLPVAVNLRTRFNEVLAASLLGGNGNVFLPLDGSQGEVLGASVREAFCSLGGPMAVVGDRDVISDTAAGVAAAVVEGDGC